MKLTEADRSTLRRARSLKRNFESGIFPTGAAQHRHFVKLVERGLLVFDGWGRDMDGEREQDVMVYQLTEAGLAALETPPENPILFTGPMVQRILDGSKTQTRRLVKSPPGIYKGLPTRVNRLPVGHPESERGTSGSCSYGEVWTEPGGWVKSPYGVPGHRLWVRETWQSVFDCPPDRCEPGIEGCTHRRVVYAATDRDGIRGYIDTADPDEKPIGWRPSIFMKRRDSRIDLEVTDLRVERLHEISEEDARAEGIVESGYSGEWVSGGMVFTGRPLAHSYFILWNEIHGRELWDENPWVWVVSFKRIRP